MVSSAMMLLLLLSASCRACARDQFAASYAIWASGAVIFYVMTVYPLLPLMNAQYFWVVSIVATTLLIFCVAFSSVQAVKYGLDPRPGSIEPRAKHRISAHVTQLILLLLATQAILSLVFTLIPPASAWDGLSDHLGWFVIARSSIEEAVDPASPLFVYEGLIKHPPANYAILSLAEYNQSLHFSTTMMPWALIYISACLFLFGYGRWLGLSQLKASIASLVFASTPLLQNHFFLPGYAEIYLFASIMLGCGLISLGLEHRFPSLILLGVISASLAIFYKNIGFLYFFCVAASLCMVVIKSRILIYGILAALTSALICLYYGALSIDLGKYSVGVIRAPDLILILGGRELHLVMNSVEDVIRNWFYSLTVLSSFSVFFLAFILCMFYRLWGLRRCTSLSQRVGRADVFLLMVVITIFGFLVASEIFTSIGFLHAQAHTDTLASRLKIPVLGPIFLLILRLIDIAERKNVAAL